MGLHSRDIDVVLDWSNVLETHRLDDLVSDTTAAVALGGTHGKVIVVGTPQDSAFTQVGDWDPVRREWWLWLRLAHAGLDSYTATTRCTRRLTRCRRRHVRAPAVLQR